MPEVVVTKQQMWGTAMPFPLPEGRLSVRSGVSLGALPARRGWRSGRSSSKLATASRRPGRSTLVRQKWIQQYQQQLDLLTDCH